MPESFDGMLAELADAAASITPLPDVAAVRRRARERTLHRRLAASALVLAVLGACGGTIAAVDARHQSVASVGTLDRAPVAGLSASPGPAGGASPSSVAGAAGTAAAPGVATAFTPVAALWQPVDGGQDLLVFPDGVIGVGEAGQWALCAGELKPIGDRTTFFVTGLSCGENGTTGLVLRLQSGGVKLGLNVPARNGNAAYTVTYRRAGDASATAYTAASAAAASGAAALIAGKELVGEWNSGVADGRRVIVLGNGYATFSGIDDTGDSVGFTGKVTAYYGGSAQVEVPCGKAEGGSSAYCQVVELQYDAKGLMTVVGSYGIESFAPAGAKYQVPPTPITVPPGTFTASADSAGGGSGYGASASPSATVSALAP